MYWIEIVPALLAGALALMVPGSAMGVVLGLRGVPLLSRAPVLSVAMIGVAAVVGPVFSVPFGPLTILATCAVFVPAAWGLHRLVGGRAGGPDGSDGPDGVERAGRGEYLVVAGAVVVAFVGIFLRVKQGIIVPDALAQLSDVIFHLNAVEYLLGTGDGSTLTLGAAASPSGTPSLYPAAWHDLHAMIHAVSGVSIVASANATVIIVSALAWPLSLLALAWTQRSSQRSFYFAGMTVAAAASALAFPSMMLTWGVLYPMLLGLALVPAFVAIAIDLVGAVEARRRREISSLVLQTLIGAAALGLAQPSALVSAAALVVPFLVASLWARRSRPTGRPRAVTILLALSLIAVVVSWILVRPARERWWARGVLGYGETWGPTLQEPHAVGEFLTSALDSGAVPWVFALLTWIGAWTTWRRPGGRWLVVAWLLSGALWVVTASWDFSLVRTLMAGPWYNDEFRVAAMTATPAVLLAGRGGAWIADHLEQLVRRVLPRVPQRWGRTAVVVLVLAGLLLTSGSRTARDAWGKVSLDYAVHEHSLLLSEDEYEVLEQVAEHVPEGDVILVNPWAGGALAYSMVDRDVSTRHVSAMAPDPYAPIITGIGDPAQRDEVCRAVEETRAHWYLDFENSADLGGTQDDVFASLEEAAQSGQLEPVVVEGDVGLYRIDDC